MNTRRNLLMLVAVLGLVISAGCSKPTDSGSGDSQSVTTDMEIVVPESEPKTE